MAVRLIFQQHLEHLIITGYENGRAEWCFKPVVLGEKGGCQAVMSKQNTGCRVYSAAAPA